MITESHIYYNHPPVCLRAIKYTRLYSAIRVNLRKMVISYWLFLDEQDKSYFVFELSEVLSIARGLVSAVLDQRAQCP